MLCPFLISFLLLVGPLSATAASDEAASPTGADDTFPSAMQKDHALRMAIKNQDRPHKTMLTFNVLFHTNRFTLGVATACKNNRLPENVRVLSSFFVRL